MDFFNKAMSLSLFSSFSFKLWICFSKSRHRFSCVATSAWKLCTLFVFMRATRRVSSRSNSSVAARYAPSLAMASCFKSYSRYWATSTFKEAFSTSNWCFSMSSSLRRFLDSKSAFSKKCLSLSAARNSSWHVLSWSINAVFCFYKSLITRSF